LVCTGFSIRIGVGAKTSGEGGEGIPEAKGMTLGWVYRSMPHLGDSYNLNLLKCTSAFRGKYMYSYNKYKYKPRSLGLLIFSPEATKPTIPSHF